MKNDNTIIIVVIVLALFLLGGFGMMGFGGCPMLGLGYTGAASIFNLIISILIIIAIVLFIIWLVKQIQEKK